MQITLNQDEIFVAIEEYVRAQITVNDDQEIDIDLKAGRGENGHSATLDIRPAKPNAKKASKPAVVRAVKTDPVPEPETDENDSETADVAEQGESEDPGSAGDADTAPADAEAKPRSSIFTKAS